MVEEHRPGKGCFYGCLTFIILVIAVALGTYFGTRKALRMAVDTYLDSKPASIPKVQMSEARQKETISRFEKNVADATTGRASAPVELSNEELNVVLRGVNRFGPVGEQFYFRVETNQLKADVSMALDQFEVWRQLGKKLMLGNLSGRYLNGTALMNAQITNGVLDLKVTDVLVNGKPLPATLIGNLKASNLAEGANTNSVSRNILQNIERLEIKEDKVQLHLKKPVQ